MLHLCSIFSAQPEDIRECKVSVVLDWLGWLDMEIQLT